MKNNNVPRLKRSAPYNAFIKRGGIVLTDDDQLRTFANTPDKRFEPNVANTAMASTSLHEIAENAKRGGCEIITFFHDHFFGGGERTLHLTHPEFIECTKKISEYAAKYGMGIGASVTNPLDLGRTFKDDVGVGGQHRTFAEGILSSDGSFTFNAYLAERWCNNKGYIYPKFDRARLFVYKEVKKDGSPYITVPYSSIREIPACDYTCERSDEPWEESATFGKLHMKVSGSTRLEGDRVFAVFYMETPEMDYFHPDVTAYVHSVIDRYRAEGVEFKELYSDEMHIQFDWNFAHFGPHELPTRYMTANFERELTARDEIFTDFDKALVYMCYDMTADRTVYGCQHTQHVIGDSPKELYRTFRMRKTYFDMLQDKVVGICCEARDYIKSTYSEPADPLCLGHATWQESPTCDKYSDAGMFNESVKAGKCTYDYSPSYVYSSTIREAISGCYDYFKWNDYFSYGGDDFCECGWFDRNYYGGAMAASLGALNRNEVASWGAWGFPNKVWRCFSPVAMSFGASMGPRQSVVTWGRPRIIDVAYVYPKDLTAVEERFGSWMVQYGYANYITADKLVSLGHIENGRLCAGLGRYSTVVVGFEPFYKPEFVELLKKFAESGGTVIWNSIPPCDEEGKTDDKWLALFGLTSAKTITESITADNVNFTGSLAALTSMRVPTDMLPDRVYPIECAEGTECVASAGGYCVGARRSLASGQLIYIGCRLRDDQSGDSGDAPSTLFDILKLTGAYGGPERTDNPATISRHTELFATSFANGAYSVANHFRGMKELWRDGFGRDNEADEKFLSDYAYMPPEMLALENFALDGHTVTYNGSGVLQFRMSDGLPVGFYGSNTTGITLDGTEYRMTELPSSIIFNELEPLRIPDGYKHGWQLITSADSIELPFAIPEGAKIYLDNGEDGRTLTPIDTVKIEGGHIILGENRNRPLVILA